MSIRSLGSSVGLCLVVLFIGTLRSQHAASPAVSAATTAEPPAPTVELVNSLGGDVRTLALSGTVAYIGEGMALVALDVSNPAQLVRRSHLPLPATVRGLQVISGTAYIADDVQGLQIVDVRQPDALVLLGSFTPPSAAIGVYVVNQRAYLACGTGGLWVLDVSNSAHPAVLGYYAGVARKVWVAGSVAAIVDGDLRLLNVSNPAVLTIAGSYLTPGDATTVQISGTVAYVADPGGLGVATLDISNPSSPTLLGTANYGSDGASAVSVAGSYAYVQTFVSSFMGGKGECSTRILDVSNPRQLTALGGWSRATSSSLCTGNVQVIGNHAYAADGDVQIVEVGDPLGPTVVGNYLPLVRATAVAIVHNVAYVIDSDRDLMILDVTKPLSPTVLGRYATSWGWPGRVQVDGSRAYVTTQDPSHPRFPAGRLLVLDVSNPRSPVLMSTYETGGAGQFSIKGDRAYVMRGRAGFTPELAIVDLSDPFNPTQLGTYGPYTQTLSLLGATDTSAYLRATGYGGSDPGTYLQVLDVSLPTTPTLRSSLAISPTSNGVAMAGATIYAATNAPELQMFAVSDPLAPQLRATYVPSGTVSRMTVVDNNAYLVTGGTNLQILDVSQPFSPTLRTTFSAPDGLVDIGVEGDTIYAVTVDGQLKVLRYTTSVSATLSTTGGTLVSVPDSTRYAFPTSTFTGTVVVKHTVRAAANLPATGDLVSIGHTFELMATDSATRLPVQPLLPYTITVQYTPTAVGPAIENTLGLYYWNGVQWVQEPSVLDTTTQTITARPNHFSLWAILGQTRRTYVPLVAR